MSIMINQLVDLINKFHIFSIIEPFNLYYLLICTFFQENNFCGNTEKKDPQEFNGLADEDKVRLIAKTRNKLKIQKVQFKKRTQYLCKALVEKYKDEIV